MSLSNSATAEAKNQDLSIRFALNPKELRLDLFLSIEHPFVGRIFEVAQLASRFAAIPGVRSDFRCGLDEKNDPQFGQKLDALMQLGAMLGADKTRADRLARQELPERLIYEEFASYARKSGMSEFASVTIKAVVSAYTWMIPSRSLVDMFRLLGEDFTDIGTGSAFLPAVLSATHGLKVVAVDIKPPATTFHPVVTADGPEYCKTGKADKSVLIFSWPRSGEMCVECIQAWKGNTFVYIGEGSEGCTGDLVGRMREPSMRKEWRQDTAIAKDVKMCEFFGINDDVYVYRRRVLDDGKAV